MVVVVVVVVVAVEEEVVTGVVKGKEVWVDKVISLCVVGGKVKVVDSVSSSAVVVAACVEVAVVEAAAGCAGAEGGVSWVVIVESGLVVGASVAGFGASVLE